MVIHADIQLDDANSKLWHMAQYYVENVVWVIIINLPHVSTYSRYRQTKEVCNSV